MEFIKKLDKKMNLPGFAMLETILAISISAILAQFLISGIMTLKRAKQQYATERNIEIVFQSLAGYVLRNGCLPYPADSSGKQFAEPENENGWRASSDTLCHGIVPFADLGIDENDVKNGSGEYFVYIVNVALCKRSDVISVPPGDPREYLDFGVSDQYLSASIYEDMFKIVAGDSTRDSVIKKDPSKQYSSYRAVRSFVDGEDEFTRTKMWDIAFRLPESEITLMSNGIKIDVSQCYNLIADHLPFADPKPEMKSSEMVVAGERSDHDKYKVGNCVAVVILNPKFAKYNGRIVSVGAGVYWQSRFGLLEKYCNIACRPEKIYVYNNNCVEKKKA